MKYRIVTICLPYFNIILRSTENKPQAAIMEVFSVLLQRITTNKKPGFQKPVDDPENTQQKYTELEIVCFGLVSLPSDPSPSSSRSFICSSTSILALTDNNRLCVVMSSWGRHN